MDQNEAKARVKAAIERYELRQTKTSEPKRHNQKPEKEVEKQVLEYMKSLGCKLTVVESKAVFSQSSGRYLSGQTIAGFPDIVGLNSQGLFLGLELKALGRRSTLKNHQRLFLTQIIHSNGFACVTDSVSHLSSLYSKFLLETNLEKRQALLLQDLPYKQNEGKNLIPLFKDT